MSTLDQVAGAPREASDPLSDVKPGEPKHTELEKRDANALMMTGAGIGVFGVVAAAIGGAVCPVCVVAAPALLGLGAFRRWRARSTTR